MIRGIRAIISKVSKETNIPPQYLYGLVCGYSKKNNLAYLNIIYDIESDDYYIGLLRVPLSYANKVKDKINKDKVELIDLFDPYINLYVGALLLKEYYNKKNNWISAIYMYNLGEEDFNRTHIDNDLFVEKVMLYAKDWFVD